MRNAPRILGLAALFLALMAGVAHAARDGIAPPPEDGEPAGARDEQFRRTVETERTRMKAEYESMRAERLERLNMAAAEAVGAVALESLDKKAEAAAARVDPVAPEEPGGRYFLLYVVGGGVLLGLVLRLRMPWLFEKRSRKPAAVAGPMTVQLKPRSQRYG